VSAPTTERQQASELEVVSEDRIGEFVIQLLEGPTDNPIRIVTGFGHQYTFWIEGAGWKILNQLLDSEAEDEIQEKRIHHLIELTKVHPEILDSTNTPAINL